jgi:hypothetical protein
MIIRRASWLPVCLGTRRSPRRARARVWAPTRLTSSIVSKHSSSAPVAGRGTSPRCELELGQRWVRRHTRPAPVRSGRVLPMRLQRDGAPDPIDRVPPHAAGLGDRAPTPMGGVRRRLRLERPRQHRLHGGIGDNAGRVWPRLVPQPVQTPPQKTRAPLAHVCFVSRSSRAT